MVKKSVQEEFSDHFAQELRRGALVLAVLARLGTAEYGYSLKQKLADAGLDINEGTLYPLLRRLEKQGLLESEWEVVDDARPRRYYRLSQEGEHVRFQLQAEWEELTRVMSILLGGKN